MTSDTGDGALAHSSSVPLLTPTGCAAVQQIKIFKSVDSELHDLEKTINKWMRKSGARVLSITGNLANQGSGTGPGMNTFAAGDVLIIVHYEVDASPKS